MDFGTFYRMRMLREQTSDMNTADANQPEHSQPPGQSESEVYRDFDQSAHQQTAFPEKFEGDGNNLHDNSANRRDFGYDQLWNFPEDGGVGGFNSMTNQSGRGLARDGGEGSGYEHPGRGRGLGQGRGRPSAIGRGQEAFNRNAWANPVNATGPWQYGGDGWEGERREHVVEERESQKGSIDWCELEQEAELQGAMMQGDPQYPTEHENVTTFSGPKAPSDNSTMRLNNLPGTSSNYPAPPPAEMTERQPHIEQKPGLKTDEKTGNQYGNKKSSQETRDQNSEVILDGTVSALRTERKTQDKPWENDIVGIEDMAETQLKDPDRTSFSCCYCGFSSTFIMEFSAHVKGEFHRKNFASLIESKRNRQQKEPMMGFKREELGKHSFLEMDLKSFKKEPVVGLSYITEYQSIFGIQCVCSLCGSMFSHILGQGHVTSNKHRMMYLKEVQPVDYGCIDSVPKRQSKITMMYKTVLTSEQDDGRGTPVIHVFEDKSSSEGNFPNSSDDPEAVKTCQQAFVEFVNQELEAAKQKIADDTYTFDYGFKGGPTFQDQSTHVELWDYEGENDFFDESSAVERNFSSDLVWEFPEEKRSFAGAGADHINLPQGSCGLIGRKRGPAPEVNDDSKNVKKPKEGQEQVDCQEGSYGNKGPKQEADDKTKNEEVMIGDKTESKIQEIVPDDELALLGGENNTCNFCSTTFLSRDDFTSHVKSQPHRDMKKSWLDLDLDTWMVKEKPFEPGTWQIAQSIKFVKSEWVQENQSGFLKYSREDLGKFSYIQKHLEDCKETILGLSFISEFQHTTDLKGLCHLCGNLFTIRSVKIHVTGFKHRLRYLRELRPQVYAGLGNITRRRELLDKLDIISKDLERTEGRGTPNFHVFEDENENEKQESHGDVFKKMVVNKSAFRKFIREEHEKEKVRLKRDPVYFESGTSTNNPSQDKPNFPDPHLMNPHMRPHLHPRPSLMGRPPLDMGVSPHLIGRPPCPSAQFQPGLLGSSPYLRGHDPHYMRMRADPYLNPDPLKRPRQDEPYLDPDPLKRRRPDNPYLDPDPLKRRRPDNPYLDPDPLKRRGPDYPYLDADSLKRARHDKSQLDLDSLKRRAYAGSYLDRNPLKRYNFDEPYIDPDPLKRILPSQKAAKKLIKPVVIDYGHGTEKKSVKNTAGQREKDIRGILNDSKYTADQWEKDIKDILNDSKAPDSLAQLSCSYSSPKKEDTPPPSKPKRQLPFTKTYMETSKEYMEKFKKVKIQALPDREDLRGRYKSGSPSRTFSRWSPPPLSMSERSRAILNDAERRSKRDSSPRKYRHSKSPEYEDSTFRKYKRSNTRSPENEATRSSLKELYEEVSSPSEMSSDDNSSPAREIKKSKSPETFDLWTKFSENEIPYDRMRQSLENSEENEDYAQKTRSMLKDTAYEKKSSNPARESKKSKSPEKFDLRTKFRENERAYDRMRRNSANSEEREDYAQKTHSMLKDTAYEKKGSNCPEKSITRPTRSRQPETVIELTSDDEENSLLQGKKVLSAHSSVEKSPPKEEPEPSTSNDVDEAQADLIAELLLTMKNSLIGEDADPQSALKAILSQDITKVLLETKGLGKKESSPPKVKQKRQDESSRDSLERHEREKARSSERHSDVKARVKQKPKPPQREKIAFSFAGRSKLAPQTALNLSDDEDEK